MYLSMKKIENMIKAMAIGDHNGYKYENMNKNLVNIINPKFLKTVIKGNLLKDSTITDDTEHMILTYLALKSKNNISVEGFSTELEKHIKKWFSTFPIGIGKATLKSCFKLTLLKKNYKNSGHFSAGNGPLMRAPIVGAFYYDNEKKRDDYIKVSTIITHTDPLAELTAYSTADIVSFLMTNNIKKDKSKFIKETLKIIQNSKNKVIITDNTLLIWDKFYSEVESISFENYENYMNCHFKKGVSGFCLDTLKMCILQIYHFNDLKTIIENCVLAGGDTDSTAGIAASIYSASNDDLDIAHDISIEFLFKIINGSYIYRLSYSIMEWINSLFSLWRFIYILKKIKK